MNRFLCGVGTVGAAIVTLASGSAFAQSSVTLYGVIDGYVDDGAPVWRHMEFLCS